MSRLTFGVCLAAFVWLLTCPAQAHHSFGAEYDGNKPVTLKGVVTKIEWTNPHSHFSLDVKDEKGRTVTWQLSGYTVNALYRTGWRRDVTMKVGDTVSVFGWRARDGSNSAHAREVTFADGKKLFYGPPAGTGEGGAAPAVKP
jgi:Family of unknown function (DUF6152)